jgi:dTDP-glucose pyrophosphorylase
LHITWNAGSEPLEIVIPREPAVVLECRYRGQPQAFRAGANRRWPMGTHDSLLEASSFVKTFGKRQGLCTACPEKIAFNQGFVTRELRIEQKRR